MGFFRRQPKHAYRIYYYGGQGYLAVVDVVKLLEFFGVDKKNISDIKKADTIARRTYEGQSKRR